jgi:predicted protein tyrosine phosphatase
MTKLEQIGARLAAITPGPWSAHPEVDAEGEAMELYRICGAGPCVVATEVSVEADATFLAHAPEDVARLLRQRTRLGEYLTRHLHDKTDPQNRWAMGYNEALADVQDFLDALDREA